MTQIKDTAVREKLEELLNAIIPLQSHIITLQAFNSDIVKEKEALEKKLREIEDWGTESLNYELNELASGVFAYKYKSGSTLSGPAYYLCANCFNIKRQKSILQRTGQDGLGIYYKCGNCGSEIIDHSKPISLNDDYPEGGGGPNGWMRA